MHELSPVAAAVERALAAARGACARSVTRVDFELVQGGHLSAETLEMLFQVLSRGTLADGAAVVVHGRKGRWQCLACASPPAEWPTETCPACGCAGQLADTRPELLLTSIDTA